MTADGFSLATINDFVGKDLGVSDWLTVSPAVFAQHEVIDDTAVFYPDIGLYRQDKLVREPIRDNIFIPSITVTTIPVSVSSGSSVWCSQAAVPLRAASGSASRAAKNAFPTE